MKKLISIETLRADLKCAWEGSEKERRDSGDWIYYIDPESMDLLKSRLRISDKLYSLSSLAFAIMNDHTIAPLQTNDKVIKLSEALIRANEAALLLSETNDGGTCNFDSPVIRLLKWKDYEIKQACELAGIEIGDKLSGFWRNYRFVSTAMHGQANCRTRMAEAAKKSLEADGYDVAMYYQMD